jgi:hypothetical protein
VIRQRPEGNGRLTANNSSKPVVARSAPTGFILQVTLPMDKERLLATLDALRAELAQASEVDPQMVAELRRLTDDIRRSTEEESDDTSVPEAAPGGLKDLLLRFEGDHPQFSAAVGKVADALAAMGF